MFFMSTAFAQTAGGSSVQPSIIESMLPILVIIGIMYFLIIRPQGKARKDHSSFLGSLKRGDNVITASGIFGTVEGLNDEFVTLQISDGVKIKILKQQIASPLKEAKQ
jgi:preprotein translocase subunit YajC